MPLENTLLKHHFSYKDIGAKCLRAICLHYDTYKDKAKSATREQDHYNNCPVLLREKEETGTLGQSLNPAKWQRTLTLDSDFISMISADKKTRIDKELAACLYKSGRPLSLFDDDCWKDFFKKNFGYTPPSS